jgi:hypothetical protein
MEKVLRSCDCHSSLICGFMGDDAGIARHVKSTGFR